MPANRRQFIHLAAGIAAAPVLAALPSEAIAQKKGKAVPDAPADALPLVDTHQHLWDLKKFRLPWLSGAPTLNHTYGPKEYEAATRGLNVVKTVYMEVDVTPEQQVEEAEYVIDLCRRDDNPMAAAVISGRPGKPGFDKHMARYKETREIKGIRQVLHGGTPRGYCLEPAFIKDMRLLGEQGKSFDICMKSAELADAVKLATACPDTRFILDHCGNKSPQEADRTEWESDLKRLAERPNVVCKVSGIIASAREGWKAPDLAPVINTVLRTFGPDRVMFGGDWPVCTLRASYREWVAALKEIVKDRTLAEQRKLFAENAIRFYGLG